MSAKQRIAAMDQLTRVQYSLMILFGASCIAAAVVPLPTDVKTALVAVFFGITAGLWISHLIEILHSAAEDAAL